MMRKCSIAAAADRMTVRLFFIIAATLAVAVIASPTAAQQRQVCDQQGCLQVDEVCYATTGCIKRVWLPRIASGRFYKVRYPGQQAFRRPGLGHIPVDLPRGIRTFQITQCRLVSGNQSGLCAPGWRSFAFSAAPPPPSEPSSSSSSSFSSSIGSMVVCRRRGGTWDSKNKKCLRASASTPASDLKKMGKIATVIRDVDVYKAPGGIGTRVGWLKGKIGLKVSLRGGQCRSDNWCNVFGDKVPGGDGWVYSGPDYRSLEF